MTKNLLVILNVATVAVIVCLAVYSITYNRHRHPQNQHQSFSNTSISNSKLSVFGKTTKSSTPASRRYSNAGGNELNLTTLQNVEHKKHHERTFPCKNLEPDSLARKLEQRGQYWAIYNYVVSSRMFNCDDSITYCTHAHATTLVPSPDSYLRYLETLLERWQGPVSITLYSPATAPLFEEMLQRISYIRQCSSPLIKEFVTFHLLLEDVGVNSTHFYLDILKAHEQDQVEQQSEACISSNKFKYSKQSTGSKSKKIKKIDGYQMYKKKYPFNIARNIARDMSSTHYVLASDAELYPSLNLIPKFLDFIKRSRSGGKEIRKVFMLPVFDLQDDSDNRNSVTNIRLPADKMQLKKVLETQRPIKNGKKQGLEDPKKTDWLETEIITKGEYDLNVFNVAKGNWEQELKDWELIYIATKLDPVYDVDPVLNEWVDRKIQAYILCINGYESHILDNAFLVQFKTELNNVRSNSKDFMISTRNQNVLTESILPKLHLLYGEAPECRF